MMEKYAVPQKDVEELVKTGACNTEAEAREAVARGDADKLLKKQKEKKDDDSV